MERLTKEAARVRTRLEKMEKKEEERNRTVVIVEMKSEEAKDKVMRMEAKLWKK